MKNLKNIVLASLTAAVVSGCSTSEELNCSSKSSTKKVLTLVESNIHANFKTNGEKDFLDDLVEMSKMFLASDGKKGLYYDVEPNIKKLKLAITDVVTKKSDQNGNYTCSAKVSSTLSGRKNSFSDPDSVIEIHYEIKPLDNQKSPEVTVQKLDASDMMHIVMPMLGIKEK